MLLTWPSTGMSLSFSFIREAMSVAVFPVKPILLIAVSKVLTAGTKARQDLDSFDTGVLALMLSRAELHVESALSNVPSTLFHSESCLDVTDADAAWAPRPKTAAVVATAANHFRRNADLCIEDLP